MFSKKSSSHVVGLALLLIALFANAHLAAQGINLVKSYDEAVAALDRADYEKGLGIVNPVLEQYAKSGLQRYGPAFGHFYYLRGMLLIRQKKYEDAIEPLRICYEEYSNEEAGENRPPNLFHVHALMQWGACLQALEKYEDAKAKFEQTLKEDPRREPRINRLAVQMNLARCLIRTGQEKEGTAMLNKVLNLDGLSPEAIQDAFTVLAADGMSSLEGPDVMQIVQQHSGSLFGSVNDRAVMNPRLASLATKALQQNNPLQAIVWYNLMTPPNQAIEEQEKRKKSFQDRRQQAAAQSRQDVVTKIDAVLKEIDEEITKQREMHAGTLLGMGAAHYQIGNIAAARAAYRQLIDYFPDYGDRALVLHNLIICSTNLQRWNDAFEYGNQFYEEFPKHELRPSISRVLAEVVFLRGDYQKSLSMAREARAGIEPGKMEREGLDFVAASSLYQMGQWAAAETELKAYVDQHPQGPRLEMVQFNLASTKVKLSKWDEAAPLLDQFTENFRDSQYRSTALYLGGLAWLILNEPTDSLIRINRLLAQHPTAPEVAGAHTIKGDSQSALEHPYDDIVRSYQMGKSEAERQGTRGTDVAGYALKQLVVTASTAERWDEAMNYFQQFQERYQDTTWRIDAVISSLDAHVALDKKEEAREMLENLVTEFSNSSGPDFDRMFRSYMDFLTDEYSEEEMMNALNRYAESKAANSPALKSWIILGQIEVLENVDEDESPDTKKIDALFQQLNQLNASSGDKLSNDALVRLAQWHHQKNNQAAALDIFNFIMKERPDGGAYGRALIETAKIDSSTDEPKRLDLAKEKFERVLNELDTPDLQEEAILGVARILIKEKDWDEALSYWLTYLDENSWTLARAEANYHYAYCLDQQKEREEALTVYISVFANFSGHLDWSMPASVRAAEILHETGRELDALTFLQDVLRRTKDQKHPDIDRAKNVFFKWREEYVAKQKP